MWSFIYKTKSYLKLHKEADAAQSPAVNVSPSDVLSQYFPGANTAPPSGSPLLAPSVAMQCLGIYYSKQHGVKAGEHLPAHPVPRGVSVDCPAKWMKKREIKNKNDFKT